MSEDLTGSRLGHYKIDSVLGRGGMSVMYRATDVRLGRKVALKVMGNHITDDAEFRERFVDEARNTSAIDHPNIVPLYDFGEIDGMLYIAMRLVNGTDLAGLVEHGPLVPARAFRLLEQVAEALDGLHEQGLVHLDLKPANVLVTAHETHDEHVYLADFGLTRRGATGHRTASGDFIGSPTYAAPEHLRGEPVDGRTDLYALSCMFYTCLTGQAPFHGDVQRIIQGHLGEPPPTAGASVPVPPAVDGVLRTGMAKSPQERYDTCRELIVAGRRAFEAGTAPSSTPPPGTPAPGLPRAPQPGAVGHGAGMPPVPAMGSGPQSTGAEQSGPPAFLPGTPPGGARHAPGQVAQPGPPQPGPAQPGPPQLGPGQPGPPQPRWPQSGPIPEGQPFPGQVPPGQVPPGQVPPGPVVPAPNGPTPAGAYTRRRQDDVGVARWVVPLLVVATVLMIVVLFLVMLS